MLHSIRLRDLPCNMVHAIVYRMDSNPNGKQHADVYSYLTSGH